MNRKYNLKLDLQFRCNNSTMKFNQFDNNTSDFFIKISNGGKSFDVEKAIVVLATIKPSGKVSSQFIEVKNGLVYVDLKPNMRDEIGTYTAKAMLILEDERVVTDSISYEVTEDKIFSLLNDTVGTSEEFTLLTDMLSRLSAIEISEEQRMINEAERILSEENRKIEETKRVEAELIRQHEEADRAKYDATRESNENIRKINEEARISSENVRLENEANRIEQEANRVKAEQLRKDNYNLMTEDEERRRSEANAHKEAEVLRVQAETNRVNEEAKRRTTEQARVSAENTRVGNENTRKANETTRQTNETQRVEAETQRQNRYNSFITDAEANANDFENYTNTAKAKEEERKSNELDRRTQEAKRVSNEVERISNENTRKVSENARIESEKQRVDAENLRKEKIIEIQSDYDSLKKVIIDENVSANLQNQINQTNSQLEHIESKLENYKVINVLDYGIVANNNKIDNTLKINEVIENVSGKVKLYFPSGEYYFKTPLKLKNIDVEGDGYSTILTYINMEDSTFIEFGGEKSYIKNLKLKNNTRNFELLQKGLVLGQRNSDGIFEYSNRLLVEYIEIENFHTSVAVESCYTIDLNNINTYKDVIGFSVNKESNEYTDTPMCTTILANHLYCNGTGGSYDQPVGSIGWEIYETSDITFINCISEMYEKSFCIDNVNNVQMIAPYFENTLNSSVFKNITGSVYMLNPYINNVIKSDEIAFVRFDAISKFTWVGGRILSDKSIGLINKTNDSSVTVINPPIDNPVNSDNGWNFSGVFVLNRNGKIDKTVRSANEYGISIGYYGTGLSFSPNTIKQNSINDPIMFNIGDTSIAKMHSNGDLELFGNAKGLIMRDYAGVRYKIFMNYDGTLKIETLE